MKPKPRLYLALFFAGGLVPARCPRFSVFLGLGLILSGLLGCSTAQIRPIGLPVRYHNAKFDLTFYLPVDWRGYSVLTENWHGETYSPSEDKIVELACGPIILLRNPLWKINDVYQDIPIYVFTRRQWDDMHAGKYDAVGAGGLIYELWHNDKYVFGIHSRTIGFDTDLRDWQKAATIVDQNQALHPMPHLYPE
ncbi:MAG TPA: hypothetical protein VH280_16625 [Verrucomicrobiae bacterium]|jgi:hypothetical protein|nr:hypothetical protein [Verrucomicrobiae bacterium]